MTRTLFLLSLSALFVLPSCARHDVQPQPQTPSKSVSAQAVSMDNAAQGSIYQMDMTLQNQRGEEVEWSSLKGKVRVMAMVFTHCESACPEIAMDIKRAADLLPSNANVEYTLISFDSKQDSVARLAQYASEMGFGNNWLLLRGADPDIQTISSLLDVKFKPMPDHKFSHQNVILVIAPDGRIALRREGIGKDPKEIAEKVKSLL